MNGRWIYPLDPDCPRVRQFYECLDDPITREAGIGSDLTEDFERRHRKTCTRCQDYGAANVDVEY